MSSQKPDADGQQPRTSQSDVELFERIIEQVGKNGISPRTLDFFSLHGPDPYNDDHVPILKEWDDFINNRKIATEALTFGPAAQAAVAEAMGKSLTLPQLEELEKRGKLPGAALVKLNEIKAGKANAKKAGVEADAMSFDQWGTLALAHISPEGGEVGADGKPMMSYAEALHSGKLALAVTTLREYVDADGKKVRMNPTVSGQLSKWAKEQTENYVSTSVADLKIQQERLNTQKLAADTTTAQASARVARASLPFREGLANRASGAMQGGAYWGGSGTMDALMGFGGASPPPGGGGYRQQMPSGAPPADGPDGELHDRGGAYPYYNGQPPAGGRKAKPKAAAAPARAGTVPLPGSEY